ncbi:GntR family transcriptional regulator [Mesorhizobium caraganae]|nr:GntR family transcriptional regulator [Mesorhizobium caraganae]
MSNRRIAPSLQRGPRLADEAYGLILGQLISLQLPPGARITVDELARQFGISQTPIREALGRLISDGLVTKTHLLAARTLRFHIEESWNRLQKASGPRPVHQPSRPRTSLQPDRERTTRRTEPVVNETRRARGRDAERAWLSFTAHSSHSRNFWKRHELAPRNPT